MMFLGDELTEIRTYCHRCGSGVISFFIKQKDIQNDKDEPCVKYIKINELYDLPDWYALRCLSCGQTESYQILPGLKNPNQTVSSGWSEQSAPKE